MPSNPKLFRSFRRAFLYMVIYEINQKMPLRPRLGFPCLLPPDLQVAWAVTLCVLLGALMWVGSGGGLAVQYSPCSAADEEQRAMATPTGGNDGEKTYSSRACRNLPN